MKDKQTVRSVLKQCPFCGNKAIKYDTDWKIEHKKECYLYEENQTTWLCSYRVVKMWNTRSETQLKDLVDVDAIVKILQKENALKDVHLCKKVYPNYFTEITSWSLIKQQEYYNEIATAVVTYLQNL